ncbi:Abi family protein [Arcanobacterium phocae]|uniref:Abi family protein n=1 Tax=Arcanobacterium phocae TaxID=131112 RepID=UPI001C0F249A|nr:Abi family protein [Arcanobacterium phocae]
MANNKCFLSIEDQVLLLEERGLIIHSKTEAEDFLRSHNYYRFSGYAREFQEDPRHGKNNFSNGISFDDISSLMDLDQRLRRLLLEALEIIEVSTRSVFAYEAGKIYGSDAFYLEKANYLAVTPGLDDHINKMHSQLLRKNQPTIERYRQGDDFSHVPVWVAIETMSFGTFARLCQYMANKDIILNTADSLAIAREGFSSTLHAYSSLRNKCAHYAQLWNRSFDISFKVRPKEKRDAPDFAHPGSYGAIIVIRRWLKQLDKDHGWFDQVTQLIDSNDLYRSGILKPKMK